MNLERFKAAINIIGLEAQEKLAKSKVAIVGIGGLGNPCALYLCTSGIGRLTLIDDDHIELNNLHRQILYTEKDIGQIKVDTAKNQLLKRCSTTQISVIHQRIRIENAETLLANHDLILDCSDNFQARYLINNTSKKLQIPLVSAALFQENGYVTTFNYKKGPCLECLFPSPAPHELTTNCSESGVLGVDIGLIALFQAKESISTLLGKPNLNSTLISFRLSSLDITKKRFIKNSSCSNSKCSREITSDYFSPHYCITFTETQALLNNNLSQARLIDVRNREEHKQSNIGGINIPYDELYKYSHTLKHQDTLILYCQSGKRSQLAYEYLIHNGFKTVYSLQGGLSSIPKDKIS